MHISEDTLDQLHQLQQKRLHDITTKGEDFHIQNSEKTLRAIYDRQKSTITFSTGEPVHTGLNLGHKNGSVYVTSFTQKAGVVVADVLPILGTIETMTTKSGNYTCSGFLPVLKRAVGEIGVPAFGAPPAGSTIRSAGELLTITSVRRDGPVSILRVQPVPPVKSAPAPRIAEPFLGNLNTSAPTAAPTKGWSPYGW